MPIAASTKKGTKHQAREASTNIGAKAYDAANMIIGGSHIHASAKQTASRARLRPCHAPQAASTANSGKAKVPVALLNSATGAHHCGRSIHAVAPFAKALAPVRSEGSATAKNIAKPAARAMATSRRAR